MSVSSVKTGLMLGCGAILLWSTSSAATRWAGLQVGPWQFLAIACCAGGLFQVAVYLRRGHTLRQILMPPPLLWAPILGCFVLYMLAYTAAVVWSMSDTQTVGVSLANYLWPTLTVVFAVLIVPGTKMTVRLLIALGLSLAGLGLANYQDAKHVVEGSSNLPVLPYVLGLVAAVTWGAYSAILARWRNWAGPYPTAPIGFLLTSLIAAIICTATGGWQTMGWGALAGIIFVGLGPEGAGYLMWELALHRAAASTLGLLGSATPVLSTFWLLMMFASTGEGKTPPSTPVLIAAACLIGGSVLIGTLGPKAPERVESRE